MTVCPVVLCAAFIVCGGVTARPPPGRFYVIGSRHISAAPAVFVKCVRLGKSRISYAKGHQSYQFHNAFAYTGTMYVKVQTSGIEQARALDFALCVRVVFAYMYISYQTQSKYYTGLRRIRLRAHYGSAAICTLARKG